MKWFTWGNTFFTQTEIGLGGKHYHSLYSKLCYTSVSVCQVFSWAFFSQSCILVNLFWKRSKASDFPPFPNMCVQKSRTYSSGLSPMLLLQWIIEGVHSKSRFSDLSKVRDVWCITECHGHTSSLIVLVNQDTNRFK